MRLPQSVSVALRLPTKLTATKLTATKLTFSLLLICAWLTPTNVYAEPGSGANTVFLPMISRAEEVQASEPTCQLNEQEQRIATLMLSHPEQQHPALDCNPILAAVARARAEDMGRRAYFNHVNPDGQGPNYLARQAGYPIPAEYNQEVNGNNIESIGAGPNNADGMWNGWMVSEKHLTHILGANEFFAQQSEYGIGFAQVPGSPYQYYWVVIISKPGP